MDAFIVNCKPSNWEICNKYTIFGLKDSNLPPLSKGDLILFRISGSSYGLKALWYFEYAKKVVNQKNIQLSDDDYTWILNCKNIITLIKRFSEEFQTSSKKSSKIADLYAGGIQKTVVAIKKPQLRDYIFHILKEYENELDVNINYMGEDVKVYEFLQKILAEIVAVEPFPEPVAKETIEPVFEQKEKNEHVSNLNDKADKSSPEKKEKPDKQISERKEKPDKTGIGQQKKANEPILKQEEKLGKQISEQKERQDKSEPEPEKTVNEPILNYEEKSDIKISEQKEKSGKTGIELKETAGKPIIQQEVELEESILETEKDFMETQNKAAVKISKQQLYEQVGERINLSILNYAPLDEKGILLLFGHYMQKLGFSHVEEIRTGFPDAIAIRSVGNGKYQRVRIGFEFNSSSFPEKSNNINDCDVIVCWNHDWNDCPIEVIELSKVLFDKGNS